MKVQYWPYHLSHNRQIDWQNYDRHSLVRVNIIPPVRSKLVHLPWVKNAIVEFVNLVEHVTILAKWLN